VARRLRRPANNPGQVIYQRYGGGANRRTSSTRIGFLSADTGKTHGANRSQESLPAFVELGGTRIPLTWHLVPHSATVDAKHVIFVYESKEPHLRLAWQWTVRAAFGPIEHRNRSRESGPRDFLDADHGQPVS